MSGNYFAFQKQFDKHQCWGQGRVVSVGKNKWQTKPLDTKINSVAWLQVKWGSGDSSRDTDKCIEKEEADSFEMMPQKQYKPACSSKNNACLRWTHGTHI